MEYPEKPKKEWVAKLTKSRVQLIMQQPFVSQLVMGMPLVYRPGLEDIGCKTMATDGRFIYWHPAWVEKCNNEELKFSLAHEGFHPGLLHHLRIGDRDHDLWNQAGDYAINSILLSAELEAPEGVLINSEWSNKSAEWIYEQLKDEQKKGKKRNVGKDWNIGAVLKPTDKHGKPLTPEKVRVEEQKWIQGFVQAANTAKAAGKLPAGIDRMIDAMTDPRLNWKSILSRFLTATVRNDYNWSRPNRRFIAQGLYMPHLQSPAIGSGVIFVDTSGSIGQRELNQLASEIKAITDAYKVDLTIVYVDHEVAGVDRIDSMSPKFELHPKGGGGTSFVPGFEYVEEERLKPSFALYLTDGWSSDFPEKPPGYPFIWVLTEKHRTFDPPFGEVLEMPDERRVA